MNVVRLTGALGLQEIRCSYQICRLVYDGRVLHVQFMPVISDLLPEICVGLVA